MLTASKWVRFFMEYLRDPGHHITLDLVAVKKLFDSEEFRPELNYLNGEFKHTLQVVYSRYNEIHEAWQGIIITKINRNEYSCDFTLLWTDDNGEERQYDLETFLDDNEIRLLLEVCYEGRRFSVNNEMFLNEDSEDLLVMYQEPPKK